MQRSLLVFAAATAAIAAACSSKEPTPSTFFDRTVSPILTTSCSRGPTSAGCHVSDAKGNALGNLDVSTYALLEKRKDLLLDYGPYGQPSLLLKAIDPLQVEVQSYDGTKSVVTTDIKHTGGSILDPTGTAFQTLRRWIQNGATENNTGLTPTNLERADCSRTIPARADFDLTKDPARPDFATFRDRVNPVFSGIGADNDLAKVKCAAGNCHGSTSSSLYLTCGDSPEQLRFNYYAAQEYLAQSAEASELLRRPLAPTQGGAYHEGGIVFGSTADDGYQRLLAWASEHGPAIAGQTDDGFTFFAHKVQPVLVKKGCMMLQCHSGAQFHDYRLHGGSGGSFSLSVTRQNYDLSIHQLALESEDPDAGRLVKKNLYRPEVCGVAGCEKPLGIVHRGGPLLEDFGAKRASVQTCLDAKYDYDNGELDKIPAYCVIAEWHRRERALRGLTSAPLTALVYVKRPTGTVRRAQDFDVYSPGADLRRIDASVTNNAVTVDKAKDVSLLAGCGLSVATADVRRPQISWDGKKVAFAARSSAQEPLAVYVMNVDGTSCAKDPVINATPASANGLLVHNFDPTWAPPDGGSTRIVFASTRGNLDPTNFDYTGPQRTPADPTKPNANLYVLEPDPAAPATQHVRQLTWLLNLERQPSFMSDGRLIMTTEKRAPNFYQLALRRLNLDSGDYHPLYAQRGSIGYPEASQVVELADKNFATIFSAPGGAPGGGALGVFNRSLGLDYGSTNASDYPIDPSILDPAAPTTPEASFFLHSLRFPDGAANGHPGKPTSGVYTSPAALPTTNMLVSFGAASDAAAFGGDYDVYEMDPVTGQKTKLLGDAATAEVEAVAVYTRVSRGVYASNANEANGTTQILPGHTESEITVLDFRVFSSLVFQNTPNGRLVDPEVSSFSVYEDLPPTLDVTTFAAGGAFVATDPFGQVYVRRRLLGSAPLESDGSVKFKIPGGVPIVLGLPDTKLSREKNLPRIQREEMQFSPGEYVHQSFKAANFDGFCGNCHNSVSGRPIDAALKPDFVTTASDTLARYKDAFDMNKAPAARGAIQDLASMSR